MNIGDIVVLKPLLDKERDKKFQPYRYNRMVAKLERKLSDGSGQWVVLLKNIKTDLLEHCHFLYTETEMELLIDNKKYLSYDQFRKHRCLCRWFN